MAIRQKKIKLEPEVFELNQDLALFVQVYNEFYIRECQDNLAVTRKSISKWDSHEGDELVSALI